MFVSVKDIYNFYIESVYHQGLLSREYNSCLVLFFYEITGKFNYLHILFIYKKQQITNILLTFDVVLYVVLSNLYFVLSNLYFVLSNLYFVLSDLYFVLSDLYFVLFLVNEADEGKKGGESDEGERPTFKSSQHLEFYRAGHFRYFLTFLIIKNDFSAFFIKLI